MENILARINLKAYFRVQFHGSCPRLRCRLWGRHTRPCFSSYIILWARGLTELCGDWESRKSDRRERIVSTLPGNEDAVKAPLYSAGTAHIILPHPEQFGLRGHFDLWTDSGRCNKWINHFWREWWCLLQSSSISGGEWLFEITCSDTTAGKSLLEELNEIPGAEKDAHLLLNTQ